MKNIKIISIFLLLTAVISGLYAEGKRYEVKSGVVEYAINGGGSIMGISSKTTGSEKLTFKNWGNVELHEEKSSTATMGHTDTTHNITKIENGKFFTVDFDQKEIIEHSPQMLKQMANKDMSKTGKEMMISMGGKKVGNGKVLGYSCEIWELMGSKTWIYKGVPLKTEANIMGMKHTNVATKAKFNISISDKEFKLPNYPSKTVDQMMNEQMGERVPSTQNSNQQMPKNAPAPQELEQLQNIMKNLGGLFGGQNK